MRKLSTTQHSPPRPKIPLIYLRWFVGYTVLSLCLEKCGSQLTENIPVNGTILSENYPMNYTDNLHNTTTIVFSDPAIVRLEVKTFILEESVNCKADYVEILADNKPVSQKLCGHLIQNMQLNLSDPLYEMSVIFHTDTSVSMQGFLMEYTAAAPDPKAICDMMHGKVGSIEVISSLLVGNQVSKLNYRYPKSLDCVWNMYTNDSYELSLEVDLLLDMFGTACEHNFLEIRVPHNGSNSITLWELALRNNKTDVWSPREVVRNTSSVHEDLLGRFCGNILKPIVFKASSQMVTVTFHSSFATEIGYFILILRPIESSRQTTTTWIRQIVSAPSVATELITRGPHPSPYPDLNIDTMTWTIQTHPGFILQYEVYYTENIYLYIFDSPTTDPNRQHRIRTRLSDREEGFSSGFYLSLLCRGFGLDCPQVMYRSLNVFNSTSHPFTVNHTILRGSQPVLFEHHTMFWQCCTYAQFTVPDGGVRIKLLTKVTIKTNADDCRYFGIYIYDGNLLEESMYGPFCEIFNGNIAFHLDNFVSKSETIYVMVYMFGDPWPYIFDVEPVLSLLLSWSTCERLDNKAIGPENKGKGCVALFFQRNKTAISYLDIPLAQSALGKYYLGGNVSQFCDGQPGFDGIIPDLYIHNSKDEFQNRTGESQIRSIHDRSGDNTSSCYDPQVLNILMGTDYGNCKQVYCGQNYTGEDDCAILITSEDEPKKCEWSLDSSPADRRSYRHSHWRIQIRKFNVKKGFRKTSLDNLTIDDGRYLVTSFTNARYPNEYHTLSDSIRIVGTSESYVNILIFAFLEYDRELDDRREQMSVSGNVSIECIRYGSVCYQFNRKKSMSWREANEHCASQNSTLLTVRSVDELHFIKTALTSVWRDALLLDGNTDVTFIGLKGTNADREGYRWTDGSPLTIADWYYPFDDLHAMLPTRTDFEFDINTIQPTADLDQACVAMVVENANYSLNWHKIPCFEEYDHPSYICKIVDSQSNSPKTSEKTIVGRNISPCPHYQFSCDDGTCLNPDSKCNRIDECLQGEDERNCVYGDNIFTCANGSLIHISLCCDGHNDCGDNSDETWCKLDDCFRCSTGLCLPKDRQCDGLNDCPDGSDESRCSEGKRCSAFRCPSGDCIPKDKQFDMVADCVGEDQHDERYDFDRSKQDMYWTVKNGEPVESKVIHKIIGCPGDENERRCNPQHRHCYPNDKQCVYDRDSQGQLMYCRNGEHLRDCQNHNCTNMFKCPDAYCIPHRRVCDQTPDCPDLSDEVDCENYTCPGLFRCNMRLCVTQDEVCDGFVHCPNSSDDEHFCEFKRGELPCPPDCLCEGYHVDCSRKNLYAIPEGVPENARTLIIHSNMLPNVLKPPSFKYLVVFDLSNNRVNKVDSGAFSVMSNLLHLRLHNNVIHTFENSTFFSLHRLRILEIQVNPISRLPLGIFSNLTSLVKLNMSHLRLEILPVGFFIGLSELRELDLAANRLHSIEPGTLSIFRNLKQLNITNNTLENLDRKSLEELKVVNLLTDSYRFCCYVEDQHVDTCSPRGDITSSCEDLLASRYHKTLVWIIGVSAFVGNGVVLVWRSRNGLKKVPSILIFNLCVSDLLMGIFLLIIASADVFYRGNYALDDPVWRDSAACRVAGVLALVSCEMSMMMIVFIAVDRALKILSPFGSVRITARRSIVVIVICWLTNISMGVLPFLLPDILGNFYGRTAICAPFLFTDISGPALHYAIALFVAPNTVALLVVTVCYMAIYISVKKSGNIAGRQDKYEVELAKKFGLIILTDFLTWLPILFTAIAYQVGIPLSPDETSIVALIILPLNSAINPYLYSFTRSKRTMEHSSTHSS